MQNQQFDTLVSMIKNIDQKFESKFEAMDQKFESKFEAMDQKFEAMDQKFEAMNQKFEAMNQKFEAMNQKFDNFRDEVNRRFDQVDRQFEQVDRQFEQNRDMIKTETHERGKMQDKLEKVYETRHEVKYKMTRDFLLKNIAWNGIMIFVGVVLINMILNK